jgi:uncharacterized membrane-anchored protein
MQTLKFTASIGILLIIILVSGIFSLKILETTSRKIEIQLADVESNTKSGNWEKAESYLSSVNTNWKQTSKVWATLIDHLEIDNIDNSLSKTEKYIYAKDTSMALAEIAALKQYIRHIPDKEAFSLENIL